jgi:DNA-directed RNA polymerase II subunit RPB2
MKIYAKYNMKIFLLDETDKEKVVKKMYNDINGSLLIGEIPAMVLSNYCNLHGWGKDYLRSINENPYTCGSEFIIGGNEYRFVIQEHKVENMLYRNRGHVKKTNEIYEVFVQSKKPDKFIYSYFTKIIIDKDDSISISVVISKDKSIKIPLVIFFRAIGILKNSQLWELITGYPHDYKSEYLNDVELILKKSFTKKISSTLFPNAETVNDIRTVQDAMLYVSSKYTVSPYHKISSSDFGNLAKLEHFSSNLLDKELLPHIGGITEVYKKQLFLAHMVKTIIDTKLEIVPIMDKEDYGNKRLQTSGVLYGQLFRHLFRPMIKRYFHPSLLNELENFSVKVKKDNYNEIIQRIFPSGRLSKLESHIANGELPTGGGNISGSRGAYNMKLGISQQVDYKSHAMVLVGANKIVSTSKQSGAKKSGNIAAKRRKVDQTFYGFIDVHDTQEGKDVGILKYKTHLAMITEYVDPIHIYDIFSNDEEFRDIIIDIHKIKYSDIYKMVKVMINGDWSFCILIQNINIFRKRAIHARRKGKIHRYTSIEMELEMKEVRIYTDAGRLIRPLYTVIGTNKDNNNEILNKIPFTPELYDGILNNTVGWDDLVDVGLIEYLSVNEIKYSSLIAFNDEDLRLGQGNYMTYSHCEISDLSVLDIITMTNPLTNHNPCARNTYNNSLSKQCGRPYSEYDEERFLTNAFYLIDPQYPLIPTIGDRLTNTYSIPSLMNPFVSVQTSNGDNIEDGICISESVIRRTFGDTLCIRTKQIKRNNSDEQIRKPEREKTLRYKSQASYSKIGNNGLPIIGSIIKYNDVYLGKVRVLSKLEIEKQSISGYMYEDRSYIYDMIDPAIIDNVVRIIRPNGYEIIKIKFRIYRSLVVGDKLSSKGAQKTTIGRILKAEDMPFCSDGFRPYLQFNPNGIISRMTQGHVKMGAACNVVVKDMKPMDGSSFNNLDNFNDLIKPMREKYNHSGEEIMFDGITGEPINNKIFISPIEYNRMPQMVKDKIYARSDGNVDPVTRQPKKGRTKQGGMRISELQRDALFSHGATNIVHNLFFDHSDKYSRYFSESNNYPCVGNPYKFIYDDVKESTNISHSRITWGGNRIYNLMMATGISLKFNFKPEDYNKKINPKRISLPILSKYERALAIGTRYRQLMYGAEPKIPLPKDIRPDLYKVAREEVMQKKINILFERKMPNGRVEYWQLSELMIVI